MSNSTLTPYFYCKNILESTSLEEKLSGFAGNLAGESPRESFIVCSPSRATAIAFSEEQIKFPKIGSLKNEGQRGKALHFFANHELLAIEMMAQAICKFVDMPQETIRSLMGTIADEQRHFKLYQSRMRDFGVEFGDFPLNAFFWSYMAKIDSYESFFAVLSLTFEQANLDFAKHYELAFSSIGDNETAEILKEVYEDEIKHVARGHNVLRRSDPNDLWTHYVDLLPPPLTPARAKGMIFDQSGRAKAGLTGSFIDLLRDYRSEFQITKRKSWEK